MIYEYVSIDKLYCGRKITKDSEKELLRLMVESISKLGMCMPIMVEKMGNGKYEILDGLLRFLAMKELKEETILCKVVQTTVKVYSERNDDKRN